ncbi:MAG: aldo/keto reductase [Bacteroidota bacterium]
MNLSSPSDFFQLHNGVNMPALGLGVYKSKDGQEVQQAIHWAIEAGYRHIDTAKIYGNERGVGEAIRNSTIPREELFVVSKVWNSDQGYDSTLKAFDTSLNLLGLEYMDLYLIHWPVKGKYLDTWGAMEKLYRSGKVRAIGVSNFMQHHLQDVITAGTIVPMVNQMEFHPRLVQQSLLEFCRNHQIQYEAWSPIMKGKVLDIPLLQELGDRYDKSPVQVTLKWALQKGVVVIPKSVNEHRIQANADLFDFELSADEMQQINALDRGERIGPDPDNFDF